MPEKCPMSKNEDESSSDKTNSKPKTDSDNKSATNAPQKYSFESVIFYGVAFFLCCSYGVFVYDKTVFSTYTPLQPLVTLFEKLEHFSPFIEFLEDDNWAASVSEKKPEAETPKETESHEEKIFTIEDLKRYDGSEGSPGIYLAMLGQVFDVTKAPQFYGPNGGYGFFSGRDASRAFVTGDFEEKGLIDDVSGLSSSDYLGLDEWLDIYHRDYSYVGKLAGRYFNLDGSQTPYYRQLQEWMLEAKNDAQSKENEKQIFPPCNSEWNADTGQRVWCTKKSGGIKRSWIGVPRKLFFPGRTERCACVKDTGDSLFDPNAKTDNGDLDNPHLNLYKSCAADPHASSCVVNPEIDLK